MKELLQYIEETYMLDVTQCVSDLENGEVTYEELVVELRDGFFGDDNSQSVLDFLEILKGVEPLEEEEEEEISPQLLREWELEKLEQEREYRAMCGF